MKTRDAFILLVLGLLALAAVLIRVYGVGPRLDPSLSSEARDQIMSLRLLRVASGASVGACLAIAGVMLQSLMRNPLASPDLIGMSAGAGLAVLTARATLGSAGAFAASSTVAGLLDGPWDLVPALVGAFAVLALVVGLSQRRGLVDPTWLVLIGVMLSTLCGAGIMLMQHLFPAAGSAGSIRVLVGALSDESTVAQVALVSAVAVAGATIGVLVGPAMDATVLGDDEARSLGVRIQRLRVVLLVTSGVLTAAAVALAGPLGFVGLVCPHAVRLLVSRRRGDRASGETGTPASKRAEVHGLQWWGVHRVRVVGSALAGVALVVGGDALVAAIRATNDSIGRVPLGVVMAFVGAPTFVILLRRGQLRGASQD